MLNYIWLSLIIVGILVAVIIDFKDITTDKFQNGKGINVTLSVDSVTQKFEKGKEYKCTISISPHELQKFFGTISSEGLLQSAELILSGEKEGAIKITTDRLTPTLWRNIAVAQRKDDGVLHGRIFFNHSSGNVIYSILVLDPVKFVKLNSVTNEGIVRYAKAAVELAIGLIGIMTVWLGVMKIAEASGLIKRLAKILTPLTTRLFPDVPADHPAMGAMIMNISANILGLANAATPLGLKAMEELNKLNKKLGTATDAMCTFLVINTSNVQLIPATVIALRAAAGSSNPTEILGAVIVATTINTIVGVTVVKLFARLKIFRRQIYEKGNQ
jgi:spore maturation protein A